MEKPMRVICYCSHMVVSERATLVLICFLTLYLTTEILDWSKLKAFADDKIKLTKMMIFVIDLVENTVGKGENAFSPFPTMFSKRFFYCGLLKVKIEW